jgi:hypothetical protein
MGGTNFFGGTSKKGEMRKVLLFRSEGQRRTESY